jgi:uncharacterized membrane protein YoaK (UPF0700 family)
MSSVTRPLPGDSPRSRAYRSRLAAALLALVTLLALAHVPLFVALHVAFAPQFLIFVLTFAVVGTVVANHEPANPIGRLMLGGALLFALVDVEGALQRRIRLVSELVPWSHGLRRRQACDR